MYYAYSFEKLDVYELARKFVVEIKILTINFPKDGRFELIS